MVLLVVFSSVAVLLAAFAILGVLSYSVARRVVTMQPVLLIGKRFAGSITDSSTACGKAVTSPRFRPSINLPLANFKAVAQPPKTC